MGAFLQGNKWLNCHKFCFYILLVFSCPSVSSIWYSYTYLYTHIMNNYFMVGSFVQRSFTTRVVNKNRMHSSFTNHGVISIYSSTVWSGTPQQNVCITATSTKLCCMNTNTEKEIRTKTQNP